MRWPKTVILFSLLLLLPMGGKAQQATEILLMDLSDRADTNMSDGIASPLTLRSVIENLSAGTYDGYIPKVIITTMNSTIEIASPLPNSCGVPNDRCTPVMAAVITRVHS
jgi:hypothetical protein